MKKILLLSVLLLTWSANAQNLKSRGNRFNPDISINSLFLWQNADKNKEHNGMGLQHTELFFTSDVDAYFKAVIMLGIENEEGSFKIHPEESYIETLGVPNWTLRLGKYKFALGKQNELHTHALPFVNGSLINTALFSDHGLAEMAVGVSRLLPLPWFSEVNVNFAQKSGEGHHHEEEGEEEGHNHAAELFNDNSREFVTAKLKNLWDLSETATVELGLSGAKGKNESGLDTDIYGVDFTMKWRPQMGGKYKSLEWTSEYLQKNDKTASEEEKTSGWYSYLKYQMAQRWFAQYRYDSATEHEVETKRHTGLVAFLPSEFSGIRLQYEDIKPENTDGDQVISLQFNISIGAHPAHAY